MHNSGATKLMEECGELVQALAKWAAFQGEEFHPDGSHQRHALQDEIADVKAAIEYFIGELCLDHRYIAVRMGEKLARFREWDGEQALLVNKTGAGADTKRNPTFEEIKNGDNRPKPGF